jgi:hypothetical protein
LNNRINKTKARCNTQIEHSSSGLRVDRLKENKN